MKFIPFIWANLWQKPVRTVVTFACVAVAFILFGMLQGADSALMAPLKSASLERLFVDGRLGLPVPLAYRDEIARLPGVRQTTEVGILAAYFQDPKNSLRVIFTEPDVWLAMRPEVHVPRDELRTALQVRTGVIINKWLETNYNWKVGDQVTVHSNVPNTEAGYDWTFNIVGEMANSEAAGGGGFMLANFNYYDRARTSEQGTATRVLVRIENSRLAATVSKRIDSLFENSTVPTRTQSERETWQTEIASIGDIGLFTHAILAAVFMTIIALTSNMMMETVRERTAELAVLRTLGFRRWAVVVLVLAEAVALCGSAAFVGLSVSAGAFPLLKDYVGTALLPPEVIGAGEGLAIVVAMVSAAIPAWLATRREIVAALAAT